MMAGLVFWELLPKAGLVVRELLVKAELVFRELLFECEVETADGEMLFLVSFTENSDWGKGLSLEFIEVWDMIE